MTGTDDGRSTAHFLAVWLPSLGAVVASGVAIFALSWWVTRSPSGGAHLGLIVGISSVLSLSTMMVVSGVLDRSDRRRAVILQLALMAAPMVALLGIFRNDQNVWAVLAAGVCYAAVLTLQTIYLGTMESVGADLAPETWPGPRVALLTQLHPQLSRVVAPIVAGGLVAAGALQGVSVVALALVLVALLAAILLARPFDVVTARHLSGTAPKDGSTTPAAPRTGFLRRTFGEARESLTIIRGHRELVFLVWFGMLANLVVAPFYSVLPAFIKEYGLTEQAQAVLYRNAASAYGIGLLVGSLALMRYGRRKLGAAASAFAVICALLLTVTIAGQDWIIVPAMTLSGMLFAVLVAVGGAAWLAHTPAAVRMRVFSLRRLVVFSSIPLGNVLMGVGGFLIGYRVFIRLLLIVVLVALAALWWRFVRTARTQAAA
ncbi:hypothetical protein ACLQ29_30035 [Micromonospora sp. DT228]|uniref:hypothetical protein n=1 Tax=Micromonospora sp. DT228 TaxID=3393443 RepID=UPI003CED8C92